VWLAESQSPIFLQALVAEIDRRCEAAVGWLLPLHPIPDPAPRGMIGRLRRGTSRQRRSLLRLGMLLSLALLPCTTFVSREHVRGRVRRVHLVALLQWFAERKPHRANLKAEIGAFLGEYAHPLVLLTGVTSSPC